MNGGWSAAAIVGSGVLPVFAFDVLTVVFCLVQVVRAVVMAWGQRARRG